MKNNRVETDWQQQTGGLGWLYSLFTCWLRPCLMSRWCTAWGRRYFIITVDQLMVSGWRLDSTSLIDTWEGGRSLQVGGKVKEEQHAVKGTPVHKTRGSLKHLQTGNRSWPVRMLCTSFWKILQKQHENRLHNQIPFTASQKKKIFIYPSRGQFNMSQVQIVSIFHSHKDADMHTLQLESLNPSVNIHSL